MLEYHTLLQCVFEHCSGTFCMIRMQCLPCQQVADIVDVATKVLMLLTIVCWCAQAVPACGRADAHQLPAAGADAGAGDRKRVGEVERGVLGQPGRLGAPPHLQPRRGAHTCQLVERFSYVHASTAPHRSPADVSTESLAVRLN